MDNPSQLEAQKKNLKKQLAKKKIIRVKRVSDIDIDLSGVTDDAITVHNHTHGVAVNTGTQLKNAIELEEITQKSIQIAHKISETKNAEAKTDLDIEESKIKPEINGHQVQPRNVTDAETSNLEQVFITNNLQLQQNDERDFARCILQITIFSYLTPALWNFAHKALQRNVAQDVIVKRIEHNRKNLAQKIAKQLKHGTGWKPFSGPVSEEGIYKILSFFGNLDLHKRTHFFKPKKIENKEKQEVKNIIKNCVDELLDPNTLSNGPN